MKIDLKKDYRFFILLLISIIIILMISFYKVNVAENTFKMPQMIIFSELSIFILTISSLIIYYTKKVKVEKIFWYIIPAIYIMFLIVMPVFKNHDEAFHWFRIYDIAQGNLLSQVIEGEPSAVINKEIIEITRFEPEKINYDYVKETIIKNEVSNQQVKADLSTTAIYNPIQYMPQTLRCINS